LVAHIAPLLFSSLSYFAAFFLLGTSGGDMSGPSPTVETIKLVLWYLPIVVEIISHFVALSLPGFVKYSTEAVYARSGTVFLIMYVISISNICNANASHSLGAGLDKITSGFQAIVGNAGLGPDGVPLFISAAVIFIAFFSLYFGTPGSTRELGNRRALAWFFSQFFFLAALIVALQGLCSLVHLSIGPILKSSVLRHCHVPLILSTLLKFICHPPLFTLSNRISTQRYGEVAVQSNRYSTG
jgi:hypothetical protein